MGTKTSYWRGLWWKGWHEPLQKSHQSNINYGKLQTALPIAPNSTTKSTVKQQVYEKTFGRAFYLYFYDIVIFYHTDSDNLKGFELEIIARLCLVYVWLFML